MTLITSILTGGANNHETTSEEANAIYTDFVSEGIVGSVGNTSGVAPSTGGMAVNAQGSPDMTVAVSTGVAYVTGVPSSQNSQTFRVKCTVGENVTISSNSSGSTKYDWVYVQLNATNLNTPNTAGDNAASFVVSRSSSAATDDGTPPTYGYPLAVVTVANGAVSITNGNIRDVRSQVALNTGTSNAVDGWTAAGEAWTVSSGYNKGQKEYDITISGDKTSKYSAGMRIKLSRGVTPPTQCTDLEASSSQYYSKTSPAGMTFTDDFVVSAWIKVESYTGADAVIASRYNGTSGWEFILDSAGSVKLRGYNAGSANGSAVTSYQAVPLNKWVHVAAQLDMSAFTATSTTSFVMIDGVDVPALVARAGTNPTALVQAGNLEIGSRNGGTSFFDGKIAQVAIYSAKVTQATIQDRMAQELTGNETNLAGYWKFDGNGNDSTSNANNLTGQNSAVATNVDNPMNATEYGIITKVAYSAPNTTMTVFTGTDYNIPNMTLSTPYYSTQKAPFGFPASRTKWYVNSLFRVQVSTTSNATYGNYNAGGDALTVPSGSWLFGMDAGLISSSTSNVEFALTDTAPTGTSLGGLVDTPSTQLYRIQSTTAANLFNEVGRRRLLDIDSATTFTLYSVGATTSAGIDSDNQLHQIVAECAYI